MSAANRQKGRRRVGKSGSESETVPAGRAELTAGKGSNIVNNTSSRESLRAHDRRILILPRSVHSATLIAKILQDAGIEVSIVSNPAETAAAIREGAAAAVIEEEALLAADAGRILGGAIATQPPWSDFPVMVFTSKPSKAPIDKLKNANVSLLERPMQPFTLVSAVRFALRARKRQYEVRDHLEALREAQAQLQLVTDTMAAAVIHCDRNSRYLWVSKRYSEWVNRPPEEIVGKTVAEIVPPESHNIVLANIERVLGGERVEFEANLFCAGKGLRWFHSVYTPTHDAGGAINGFVGVVADLTTLKHAEDALIRSEKLASAGRMAASVAHEINNPLATVTNAVYLAGRDSSLSEAAREHLKMAERELARVAQLTRQTLAFYRETASSKTFRLRDTIENVVEMYRPKLSSNGIEMQASYAADDRLNAVEGEVRQIISNLVANAIDAIGQKGGRIRIKTSCFSVLKGTEGALCFSIFDNGIGMDAKQRARIFEPFYTTKESVGTGLGLWITRELAKRQNATIRLRSALGKGTVFSVYFHPTEKVSRSAA